MQRIFLRYTANFVSKRHRVGLWDKGRPNFDGERNSKYQPELRQQGEAGRLRKFWLSGQVAVVINNSVANEFMLLALPRSNRSYRRRNQKACCDLILEKTGGLHGLGKREGTRKSSFGCLHRVAPRETRGLYVLYDGFRLIL